MYQNLECSALFAAKRPCHLAACDHSISQPQTRSTTPRPAGITTTPTTSSSSSSSSHSGSRRSVSRPSSHSRSRARSHTHSARDPATPSSSQLFSNALDPLTASLDEDTDRGSDADHQVKLALTDLLNCADVRADADVRRWVQNRLMDVERRLKARRKSHILGVR